MTFKINGTDITDYIAYRGLKWQRSDIDSAQAGRTMDGKMHRGRVTTKIRLDVTCRPLTTAEASTLLNLILPEYVSVTYDDPQDGTVTRTMYANNNPASYLIRQKDGTEYWDGIEFPLVEQ